MIDEKKITEAVNAYIGYPKEIDEGVGTSMRRDAFRAGVEWFKQAIWYDASEEDCLAEGIVDFESRINKAHFYSITDESATYGTAKKPYSLLIDKISGKGT